MTNLSMNGVFASRVDYFCLVCECRLRDEGDAVAHIVKPVHTKKFDTTEYFGNEQECVRKIKKWYLCELCNLVLPTAARVRLHVVESTHVENRAGRALQRKGSCVVAFSSVQVDDRAWNGIVDDTCAICNTEFDDEHIHRNETSHILKLIQSKVEFDENQNMFRRVDESTFHCITCNKVAALNSIEIHFNDVEHKNFYQCCCDQNKSNQDDNKVEIEAENAIPVASINTPESIEVHDVKQSEKDEEIINNVNSSLGVNAELDKDEIINLPELSSGNSTEVISYEKIDDDDEKTERNLGNEEILNSIQDFQSNDLNINVESQTVIEDQISEHKIDDVSTSSSSDDLETIPVTSDIDLTDNEELPNGNISPVLTIKDEEQKKKRKSNVKKSKEPSSSYIDATIFANEHDMTYLDSENKVYCNKCKVNIPTSLKCLEEHVAGSAHLKATNKQNLQVAVFEGKPNESYEESSRNKITAESFIRNTVFIDGVVKAVVINDSICINLLSFELMVQENNSFRCLICNCKVPMHDFDFHRKGPSHSKLFSRSFVMTELASEFIREIRPGRFHCGYCNILHTPWSDMVTHIQSPDHRESRSSAHLRLRRLMPEIIEHRREQQFNRMMNVFGFMMGGWNRRRSYDSDSD